MTRPTTAMRAAIAAAEVGDDVFGEDPTILRLQERAAAIAGKEAALFVPSGTMANQLAIRTQTQPGDEILLEQDSHPFNYESGAPAVLSGAQIRALPGERGVIRAGQIAAALRGTNDHYAPQTLIIVENTHNRAGGAVFPLGEIARISALAREQGLALHMDGARIFNAAVASGQPVAEYARLSDTISFCFSKGLGAPVGSVLAGSRELVGRARRFRKMLGGGMRQAGILAAAALHALDHHVERLAEDHARARRLAAALAEAPRLRVVNDPPETNIVLVEVDGPPAPQFCQALQAEDVWVLPVSPVRMRLVTHLDVNDAGIDRAIEIFRGAAGRI
jgi:threonine aldolase